MNIIAGNTKSRGMKRTLLLAAAAVLCIICAAAAGCITITLPSDTNPSTYVPTPAGPGPVTSVVPGEWEGVLINADSTLVKYKIDCKFGGSAELEIDKRVGVKDQERTYYGTWTETGAGEYSLVFEAAGTYTFVMNNDGTGTLTTPEAATVTLYPDHYSAVTPDPFIGDWDGRVIKDSGVQIEYNIDIQRSGTAEIEIETTVPRVSETDVTYYGTWTQTAENVYEITGSIPGLVETHTYTMTLAENGTATLSTPDNGDVLLIRDY